MEKQHSKFAVHNRKVTVRFTVADYTNLQERFSKTTCSKISEYIRALVLAKPVVTKLRNASLDDLIEELVEVRKELNAIGNNYNQAVKKLHTLSQLHEFRTWLLKNEKTQKILMHKTELILYHIAKISDKWLQE